MIKEFQSSSFISSLSLEIVTQPNVVGDVGVANVTNATNATNAKRRQVDQRVWKLMLVDIFESVFRFNQH